jgi:hypothetical protein
MTENVATAGTLASFRRRLDLGATWPFVLFAWTSSRLLFLVVGVLSHAYMAPVAPGGYPREPSGALNYWAHWDGGWFSAIAQFGYDGSDTLAEPLWPSSANFFPLYPMTIRAGTLIGGGPALWGVLISLAASLATLYFLYELSRDLFDAEVARAATLSLAFFPTAFFLNAVYSEGLFLATAIGAVWAARVRGDFVLAGALGCLAAATRNVGVLVLLPLVHESIRRRRAGAAAWPSLTALALVPLGLLTYMFWLWRWSSDPLLFSTVVQRTWGRRLTSPAVTLERAWDGAVNGAHWAAHPISVLSVPETNPFWNATETFNLAFLVLLAVLVVGVAVTLPAGLTLYAVAVAALPVLTPASVQALASLPRYFLAAFPVFIFLGVVLARRRVVLAVWLTASTALGVLFTLFFTTWRWVG